MNARYADDRYNIVCFWKQNDSDIYGRRQDMLVKYLSLHPKVNRIVHFDAPIEWRALRSQLNLGTNSRLSQSHLVYVQTASRLLHLRDSGAVKRRVFVYKKDRSNGLFPGEDGYLDFIRQHLDEQDVWSRRTVFWFWPKNFDFSDIVRAFSPELVVADVVDDHRRWPVPAQYRERLDRNYREILQKSDVVLANCESVQRAMEELGSATHVIPNACELPTRVKREFDCPRELRGMGGPVIGYVGNLDSTRLDVDLLEQVAEARPEWQLVLIGSVHASGDVLRLRRFANVHFLGVKKYDEAAQYISHFDVAMIPHLRNELTEVMNPLKAFVYCALNVPVVATNIDNIEEMGDLITIAHNRKGFLKAIESCLRRGAPADLTMERLRLLQTHSWNERTVRIMEIIDEAWSHMDEENVTHDIQKVAHLADSPLCPR